MKIAIDIDKTLVDCKSLLYEIINLSLSDQDGTKKLKYFEVKDTNPNIKGIISRISRMYKEKYYTLCENSNEIINNLYDEGNEIILLSSRPKGKSFVSGLIRCINQFDIKFSKMIISCNNKGLYCKSNNIDLLIDNSYVTCLSTSTIGINSICYMRKVDKSCKNSKNLFVCNSWEEVNKKVNELSKTLNNKKR